jgi:hypothetical protein
MVLLAKWLLEHDPHARILTITDRDELDKQIEGVMRNAGVIGRDAPSPRVRRPILKDTTPHCVRQRQIFSVEPAEMRYEPKVRRRQKQLVGLPPLTRRASFEAGVTDTRRSRFTESVKAFRIANSLP